jgi:hypothetical protein
MDGLRLTPGRRVGYAHVMTVTFLHGVLRAGKQRTPVTRGPPASVCLSAQSVGLLVRPVRSSTRPAVCLSVRPQVRQSVGTLVRPVHLSARPAVCPSARLSVPSASLPGRPAVRPSVRRYISPLVRSSVPFARPAGRPTCWDQAGERRPYPHQPE